jgi:hypothetical protein
MALTIWAFAAADIVNFFAGFATADFTFAFAHRGAAR